MGDPAVQPTLEESVGVYRLGLSLHVLAEVEGILDTVRAPRWQGAAGRDFRQLVDELVTHVRQLQEEVVDAREPTAAFDRARHAALRTGQG